MIVITLAITLERFKDLKEKSNEPDYDGDKDQLEEEQKVETKIIITSRNQVF